jgi:hypothetical protein
MSQDRGAQEPSMEEILSSIRRIIAEDDKAQGEPDALSAGATGGRPGGAEEDVLELTEIATDGPAPETAAEATPAPAATDDSSKKEADRVDRSASAEGLVSGTAATASTSAMARLSRAAAPEERKPSASSGQSMDEFITGLLRPMLKDWLDQHLPEIVERIVEQEIKKLARRAELS